MRDQMMWCDTCRDYRVFEQEVGVVWRCQTCLQTRRLTGGGPRRSVPLSQEARTWAADWEAKHAVALTPSAVDALFTEARWLTLTRDPGASARPLNTLRIASAPTPTRAHRPQRRNNLYGALPYHCLRRPRRDFY